MADKHFLSDRLDDFEVKTVKRIKQGEDQNKNFKVELISTLKEDKVLALGRCEKLEALI